METKANFVLIGLFTLAGIVGAFAFLLWFAKIQVDRQYSYYDVLFENVAGLGTAGDVRYNGLPVGQVVDLAIDETDPSKVRIRIEVAAETPVNTETIARLQSQGVTGVSYVGLSGGSDEADPLPDGALIKSELSALQSVFDGAPMLLERAIGLLEDVNAVFNEENLEAVDAILSNAASASGRLDRVLGDFESLSSDLGTAAREVAAFTTRLDALAETADTTLTAATQTFETANTTLADISRIASADVPGLIADFQQTSQIARQTIEELGTEVARVSGRIDEVVAAGQVTLDTANTTFAAAATTLSDISTAMGDASTTLNTANDAFEKANELLDTDFSRIASDVSRAADVFTITVTDAYQNIEEISDEVLAASRSAASFMRTLETVVTENRRQVSDFLRIGLPEILVFTEEARALVVNLGRLVNRVERDPARFLLGTQNSEFRR